MSRKHLSPANVLAAAALFIALGGTAVAATAIPRDSVGPPQIRQDAVRSPEIAAGAVRSSELRDAGVKLADIAPGAATALRGDLRAAEKQNGPLDLVPSCGGIDLSVCPDFVVLDLAAGSGARTVEPAEPEPARNWLVQAKADIVSVKEVALVNRCGLVDTTATGPRAVLDEVRSIDDGTVALSAVVKKGAGDPRIAFRCTSQAGSTGVDQLAPMDVKLTALEVGAVSGT